VKNFERFWSHHVDRIKERAERVAKERAAAAAASSSSHARNKSDAKEK